MNLRKASVINRFNRIYNSGFGFPGLKPKVFLVGLNKTATTSFHKFFWRQGLISAHWSLQGQPMAPQVAQLGSIDACREYFGRAQVFSDFTYLTDSQFNEPLELYPLWHEAYPNAYFILNDRDVDRWLESRIKYKNGSFLGRYMK